LSSDVRPASEDVSDEAPASLTPGEAFRIALPNFEGPLDLLLHLIREHKLDIFDIPIALITEKYVEHLERMREVNLDIAGEFLVMASTLAHIKSRLLLPRQEAQGELEPPPEEQADPRAELVRRLLEYQKYKEVAEQLGARGVLDRDVFTRRVAAETTPVPVEEAVLVEISVYRLIEALDRVLKNVAPEVQHEVTRERVTISDAIHRVAERLRAEGTVSFYALFEGQRRRSDIVATFLAILEMCKLKLIRVHQEEGSDDILLSVRGDALSQFTTAEVDESEYK
jgi:segregation and condensation protein A